MIPTDNKAEQIRDYYDFWFGVNNLYESWAKAQGLTSNALFALYIIHRQPKNCTQKTICDNLLLPKQTVNTILNNFEQKGWISRQTASHDKRTKYLVLTPAGQRYADQVLGKLFYLEQQALQKMPPAARAAMTENNRLFLQCLRQTLVAAPK